LAVALAVAVSLRELDSLVGREEVRRLALSAPLVLVVVLLLTKATTAALTDLLILLAAVVALVPLVALRLRAKQEMVVLG
jgi:hypothetical protein